jgi:putative ABC transport system permease protein
MFKGLHAALEGTKAAFLSIRAHALRSALTTLGIIIGVAAVITVVAIMQGLSHSISSQLDDLGSDMITLKAYTSTEQQMLGVFNRLHHDDFLMLKSRAQNVEDMTATMQAFSMGSQVQYGRNSTQTQIIGTDSSYQNVVRVYPELGRFLSLSDDDHRRRVAFIGSSLIRKLDLPPNPVGEFINLSGDWFRIIGVAETRGSLFGFDQDNYIIAPFSTIRSLTGERAAANVEVMFRPSANADAQQVQEQMRQLLRQRYRLQQDDSDSFEFISAERMIEQL